MKIKPDLLEYIRTIHIKGYVMQTEDYKLEEEFFADTWDGHMKRSTLDWKLQQTITKETLSVFNSFFLAGLKPDQVAKAMAIQGMSVDMDKLRKDLDEGKSDNSR